MMDFYMHAVLGGVMHFSVGKEKTGESGQHAEEREYDKHGVLLLFG